MRRCTARAVAAVEGAAARRDALPADDPRREALEAEIEAGLSRWARELEALGVEHRGVWRVVFDNGRGYLAWSWPERELSRFFGYDEDFDARRRIQ